MVTICQKQMEWESLREYASNATQFCESFNFIEKTDLRAKGASSPNSKKTEEQQNKAADVFGWHCIFGLGDIFNPFIVIGPTRFRYVATDLIENPTSKSNFDTRIWHKKHCLVHHARRFLIISFLRFFQGFGSRNGLTKGLKNVHSGDNLDFFDG